MLTAARRQLTNGTLATAPVTKTHHYDTAMKHAYEQNSAHSGASTILPAAHPSSEPPVNAPQSANAVMTLKQGSGPEKIYPLSKNDDLITPPKNIVLASLLKAILPPVNRRYQG